MSWLFSQVLVEAYSADICSDGEQSAPLNGNHTQQAYCASDKMKDFSRLSRFGMTYKPLTENRGEELLMSYRADFHAKTYPQQDEAKESKASEVECGRTWHESFARFDHVTSSWKTLQCSLLEDLDKFSETWPRSGIMRDGACSVLTIPERHTSEIESGSKQNWPTPRSCSAMASKISPESAWSDNRFQNLETVVGRRMWPTPTCHNAKEFDSPSEANRNTPSLCHQARGGDTTLPKFLNPVWVEWLMGWPQGWTDLKPSATDKYQQWQHSHGIY